MNNLSEMNVNTERDTKTPIGFGQYSKVYEHAEAGRSFALKVLETSSKSLQQELNIKNEVKILQTIDHEGVVHLHDHWKEDGKQYLKLEFCNGGDLKKHLTEGKPLSEGIVRHIARQLVSALDHLHSESVIHRDIKPSNILIHFLDREGLLRPQKKLSDDSRFCVKLGDFGFACRQLDKAPLNQYYGTPSYMSPQVLAGRPYSFDSDIWSLGVTIFELLTGRLPFIGHSKQDLIYKHSQGHYSLRRKIALSYECLEFLNHCLQVYPKNRATAASLKALAFLTSDEYSFVGEEKANQMFSQYDFIPRRADLLDDQNKLTMNGIDHQHFKKQYYKKSQPAKHENKKVRSNDIVLEDLLPADMDVLKPHSHEEQTFKKFLNNKIDSLSSSSAINSWPMNIRDETSQHSMRGPPIGPLSCFLTSPDQDDKRNQSPLNASSGHRRASDPQMPNLTQHPDSAVQVQLQRFATQKSTFHSLYAKQKMGKESGSLKADTTEKSADDYFQEDTKQGQEKSSWKNFKADLRGLPASKPSKSDDLTIHILPPYKRQDTPSEGFNSDDSEMSCDFEEINLPEDADGRPAEQVGANVANQGLPQNIFEPKHGLTFK